MPYNPYVLGGQNPVFSESHGFRTIILPACYDLAACEFLGVDPVASVLEDGGWERIGPGPAGTGYPSGGTYVLKGENLPDPSDYEVHGPGWIMRNAIGQTIWIRSTLSLWGLGQVMPRIRIFGHGGYTSYKDTVAFLPGAGAYGNSDRPFSVGRRNTFIANPYNLSCVSEDGAGTCFFLGSPIAFGSTGGNLGPQPYLAYLSNAYDPYFSVDYHAINNYHDIAVIDQKIPAASGGGYGGSGFVCPNYVGFNAFNLHTPSGRPIAFAPGLQVTHGGDIFGMDGFGLDLVGLTEVGVFGTVRTLFDHLCFCLAMSDGQQFNTPWSVWVAFSP